MCETLMMQHLDNSSTVDAWDWSPDARGRLKRYNFSKDKTKKRKRMNKTRVADASLHQEFTRMTVYHCDALL